MASKYIPVASVKLSVNQALDLIHHFHDAVITTDEALLVEEASNGTDSQLLLIGVKDSITKFFAKGKTLEQVLEQREFFFSELPAGYKFCYLEDAEFGKQKSKSKTLTSSTAGLYLIYPDMTFIFGPLGMNTCTEYEVDVTGGM